MSTKQIWVYCECHDSKVIHVSFELASKAKELSQVGNLIVTGLVFEDLSESDRHELVSCGVDRIIKIYCDKYKNKDDRIIASAIAYLAEIERPEILLIGGTTHGRSIAPWIASCLHTGLTADCVGLAIDSISGKLVQTRPAFSGNLFAEILCEQHTPQIATVRPKVFPIIRSSKNRTCNISSVSIPNQMLPDSAIVGTNDYSDVLTLDTAEIVLAGGKGIGKQGFDDLFKLSRLLGQHSSVGATRAVVDLGWIDYKYQIGQSGFIVKPRIYVAFGISGASEHIVGMSRSNTIVSINTDPNAPIFKYSHYKIVGDANKYIRLLINKVEHSKQS